MTAKKSPKGFSIARKYAMNTDAEVNGLWRDYEEGSRLLVARYGNTEFGKLERQLRTELAKQLESEDESVREEATIKLNVRLFAQTILKGWENILDEDGEPVAYSTQAAEEFLQYPEFFRAVLDLCTEIEKYRRYQVEDAVKN